MLGSCSSLSVSLYWFMSIMGNKPKAKARRAKEEEEEAARQRQGQGQEMHYIWFHNVYALNGRWERKLLIHGYEGIRLEYYCYRLCLPASSLDHRQQEMTLTAVGCTLMIKFKRQRPESKGWVVWAAKALVFSRVSLLIAGILYERKHNPLLANYCWWLQLK